MPKQRQHFAGFSGVWANVAADKVVGVGEIVFGRIHLSKLKFTFPKSELDLFTNRLRRSFLEHNRFGWQVKTATTNGVFRPKKKQFRIVEMAGFPYIFHIRCRTIFYPELHHNYVEYF
ncbi:MAG TPA: hypothetical protein VL863_09465 [bacterium]|nr:hypothetical protein [bacterium]